MPQWTIHLTNKTASAPRHWNLEPIIPKPKSITYYYTSKILQTHKFTTSTDTFTDNDHHKIINYDVMVESPAQPGAECAIRLEPIQGTELAHKTCVMVACKDCFLTWLGPNRTCPNCRGEVRDLCMCERDITDLTAADLGVDEEQVELVQAMLQAMLQPPSHRVARHLGDIYRSLVNGHEQAPESTTLAWDLIRNAVHDGLNTSSPDHDSIEVATPIALVDRRQELQLGAHSIGFLFMAARLAGVRHFFSADRIIGTSIQYWVPVMSDIIPVMTVSGIPMAETEIRARLDRGSSLVQISIPTFILAEFVRMARALYPWQSQDGVRDLYGDDITHWALLDLRDHDTANDLAEGAGNIYAIPWGYDIQQGYETRQFPGWAHRDVSIDQGWDLDGMASNMVDGVVRTVAGRWDVVTDFDDDTEAYYGATPLEDGEVQAGAVSFTASRHHSPPSGTRRPSA